MASILDKGWGNVSPNFSGSNQSMSTSVSALANAGTIFDKLSNTLEQQEQNRINNQINFEKLAMAQDANRRAEEEAAYIMLEREEVGQALELENDILRQSTNADGSTNLQKYAELSSKMRQSVKTAGAEKALTDLYQQRFKNNDTIGDNKRADAQLSLSRANHALSASRFAYQKQRDVTEDRQKALIAAQEAQERQDLNRAFINASTTGKVTGVSPVPTSSMSPDAHISTSEYTSRLTNAVLNADFKDVQDIVEASNKYQATAVKDQNIQVEAGLEIEATLSKFQGSDKEAANVYVEAQKQRGASNTQILKGLNSMTTKEAVTTKVGDRTSKQDRLHFEGTTRKKGPPQYTRGLRVEGQRVKAKDDLAVPDSRSKYAEELYKKSSESGKVWHEWDATEDKNTISTYLEWLSADMTGQDVVNAWDRAELTNDDWGDFEETAIAFRDGKVPENGNKFYKTILEMRMKKDTASLSEAELKYAYDNNMLNTQQEKAYTTAVQTRDKQLQAQRKAEEEAAQQLERNRLTTLYDTYKETGSTEGTSLNTRPQMSLSEIQEIMKDGVITAAEERRILRTRGGAARLQALKDYLPTR